MLGIESVGLLLKEICENLREISPELLTGLKSQSVSRRFSQIFSADVRR